MLSQFNTAVLIYHAIQTRNYYFLFFLQNNNNNKIWDTLLSNKMKVPTKTKPFRKVCHHKTGRIFQDFLSHCVSNKLKSLLTENVLIIHILYFFTPV